MLSVTDLSTHEYCKRKLYLAKNFGLRDPPKEATIKGLLVHELYRRMNEAEKDVVMKLDSEDIKNIKKNYAEEYAKILEALKKEDIKEELIEKIKKMIEKEAEERAENALRNVQGKKLFGEELWKVFTPKMRSEEKVISEKLGILGVVDAIKEYDDELIPIEMKTGSAPKEGVWPAHKLQLAAYMSILSSANKKRVKKGIIKYIDESIERQIILNPFMEEEIHKKILAVNMTLQGRLPGFTDNKNKCRMCGLRETCYDEERMGDLVEKRMLKNS